MNTRAPCALLALGLAMFTLLVPRGVLAIHRQTPFLVAIPSDSSGETSNPGPSWGEPRWVAFESTSDLLGNGSRGREIFLFDLVNGVLGQVTNFDGDSAHPSTSALGTLLAFDSAADILGTGSSARQIYVWKRTEQRFLQLTRGSADSTQPKVDFKGETVTFQSSADLLGRGTTGTQIFLHDLTGRQRTALVQVTDTPGNSTNPVISGKGRFVFFQSDAPLLGTASGYQQIYVYDRSLAQITALTSGAGNSVRPSTDNDGRFVAFQSEADLLGNGSTGWQIFLLNRETGELRQITRATGGNSLAPSLGSFDQFVTFVSTADLLSIGSAGQHVFFFDPRTALLYQVTTDQGTTSDHAISAGGNFIIFDSNEDLLNTGVSGRRVYSVNTFRHIIRPTIGKRQFDIVVGGPSEEKLLASDWSYGSSFAYGGAMQLVINERSPDAEAPIDIPAANVSLPPVTVPGLGAMCITATADGDGYYDCDGGRAGGDIQVTRDHDTTDSDPGCLVGCPDDVACEGSLPGPHTGVCNGPVGTARSGIFKPGGMEIRLPVAIALAVDAGPDGTFCNQDDRYLNATFQSATLQLTTGAATATITDADDVAGVTLTASETGAPFDCRALEAGNLSGGQLVGMLPLLHVPNMPTGLRDVILTLRLAGDGTTPAPSCTDAIACRQVLTLCSADADCQDGNVCNGIETCVNNRCFPGTWLSCDDGNACNGVEVCDPSLGCQAGTAPSCDDGARCTTDICDPVLGCVHTPIPNCCTADVDCRDQDVCNGNERCVGGDCVPGVPLVCDDGDACNGNETCDPTLGCQAGAADRFSIDSITCQLDAIQQGLDTATERALGGRRRARRLRRYLTKVRRAVGRAMDAGRRSRKFRSSLKRATARLRTFVRVLRRGVKRGIAEPAVAEPLIDLAREAVTRIEHVRAGAPQP